jgi:putative hydrolase of the HAD superfamily
MPFLDQFDVILFDLNGTFMFGHDRFGPEQDYFATYRSCGGTRLDRQVLASMVSRCLDRLMRVYNDPKYVDDFPTLEEAFTEFADAQPEDLQTLCATFAAHELGRVPPSHVSLLQQLSTSHQLGVVSNICSDPAPWRAYLSHVGLGSVFTSTVFSSEGRSIKPSPRLFQQAFDAFPHAKRILFVGDSWERDIVPAKQLGCATAWITDSVSSGADCVIPSILALPIATTARHQA